MLKPVVKNVERKPFSYRCFINKELQKPTVGLTVSSQFHLELGEKNQAVIVEDRPCDWVELQNKDLDKVGLANVLKMAQKGLVDLQDLAFSDDEALDLGDMDPMNPESIKKTISSAQANSQKLQATADQLGISVEELIDGVVKGTLADIIESKTKVEETAKEGE